MREVLSSKIHKATVTEADLNYVGSITIDEEILRRFRSYCKENKINMSQVIENKIKEFLHSEK